MRPTMENDIMVCHHIPTFNGPLWQPRSAKSGAGGLRVVVIERGATEAYASLILSCGTPNAIYSDDPSLKS